MRRKKRTSASGGCDSTANVTGQSFRRQDTRQDWTNPQQKGEAVEVLAKQVLALERWLEKNLTEQVNKPPLKTLVSMLNQPVVQDLEPDPGGGPGVRVAEQVAEDRRVSVADGEIRHGRKTKSKRFNGYKRYVGPDMASDVILACAVTPANRAEHEALPPLKADITRQGLRIGEAHLTVATWAAMRCRRSNRKAERSSASRGARRTGELFTKDDFVINLRAMTITCPAGKAQVIVLGRTAKFPASGCDRCKPREQCTNGSVGHGRTVGIAGDERLQQRIRRAAKSRAGRQRCRQRVCVEHRLAHLGYRQGRRASLPRRPQEPVRHPPRGPHPEPRDCPAEGGVN